MTMKKIAPGRYMMTCTRCSALVPMMLLWACGPGSPAQGSQGESGPGAPGDTQTAAAARSDQVGAANDSTLAADTLWSFDDVEIGALPAGWRTEATRARGEGALWSVQPSADAPSGGRVLSLTDPRGASGSTFNLAWTDRVSFLDGTIEVKVKAATGREDQGGGPIWRVQDKDNYYIARWNPLEDNFRVYYVEDGSRTMLANARVSLPRDRWHTITIHQDGSRIEAGIDGGEPLRATDHRFTSPGGVGIWTKADAATSFDDVRVHPVTR